MPLHCQLACAACGRYTSTTSGPHCAVGAHHAAATCVHLSVLRRRTVRHCPTPRVRRLNPLQLAWRRWLWALTGMDGAREELGANAMPNASFWRALPSLVHGEPPVTPGAPTTRLSLVNRNVKLAVPIPYDRHRLRGAP